MDIPQKIFDGHNDTLLCLHLPERSNGRSFFERSELGYLDLPRAREGGFAGGIFAIFTPDPADTTLGTRKDRLTITDTGYVVAYDEAIDPGYAYSFTSDVLGTLDGLVERSNGEIAAVTSVADIERCFSEDQLAIVVHFEGAEAIGRDLKHLDDFYSRGLRSLGLVWSRPNCFGQGVQFKFPSSPDIGPGLTDAGIELVTACNQLGVIVDLSHLNEKGFWDVQKTTDAPLVVSHSAVHSLSPLSPQPD